MKSVILLDLDETLYPYGQFVAGGLRAAAGYVSARYGLEEKVFLRECLLEQVRQGNSGHVFDQVLETMKLPKDILPELVNAFRNHKPRIRLYQDARCFLQLIHGRANLGIVTDGLKWVQQQKVEALGIKPYFQSIVYSDTYGRANWKPSPRPYIEALKEIGSTSPPKMVYIGDNPYKDFVGAKDLGFYTLRLLRGQFRHARVDARLDAHRSITSYTEIDLRDLLNGY